MWRRQKAPSEKLGKRVGAASGFSAYLLLMTKAAMRITTSTTLPETETSSDSGVGPVSDDPGRHWQRELHNRHLGEVLRVRNLTVTSFDSLKPFERLTCLLCSS